MSEQSKQEAVIAQLDELAVVDFLADNPDFFSRHPNLLGTLRLPHADLGTVSLTERQLTVLRQQNADLKEEITELMSVAARNERIFRVYSQLYTDLLGCEQIAEVQRLLQQHLSEQLGLPVVALRLFDYGGGERQLTLIRDDAEQVLTRRLGGGSCYFGRLGQQEQWILFGDKQVESAALLLIGEPGEAHGILAIGSHDAHHFEPDMDSLLVDQLRALLSTLLPRLIANHEA
ncbi:DUF484 family protein [Corallincola platygyrae]|uniref:DUF484 family protein n=1 Tax=Corallincola platygyrae TaxID=1193278 RepID=A0ABW4XLR9_9GAMM